MPALLMAEKKPAPWVGNDLNGLICRGKAQGYGPYNYLNAKHRKNHLEIVETHHFSRDTANLIRPMISSFADDFDYTLRAWPNHHRALRSLIRYQIELVKNIRKKDAKLGKKLLSPAECYLQRAINFSPKDITVYSYYGYFLRKIGEFEKAIKPYEQALKISPNNPKLEYGYSFLLIDLKRYEEATQHAKNAYRKGSPPIGLKNRLKKLGLWNIEKSQGIE